MLSKCTIKKKNKNIVNFHLTHIFVCVLFNLSDYKKSIYRKNLVLSCIQYDLYLKSYIYAVLLLRGFTLTRSRKITKFELIL